MSTSPSPSPAEHYNAELNIICESAISKVAYLGFLAKKDRHEVYQDLISQLPQNRRKMADDEIRAEVNCIYANPRPPEPGPLDDPLPDTSKHQQESVVEPVPQDTSNKSIIESLNKKPRRYYARRKVCCVKSCR